MLYEKKRIPKVGEGWVSETKLFYLLQEKFPELETSNTQVLTG